MALTNILREPRRELTEQTFGFLAIGGFVALDLLIGTGFCLLLHGTVHVGKGEFTACCLVGVFIIFALAATVFIMHIIGEGICNAMARSGYDPRPQRGTTNQPNQRRQYTQLF